MYLIGDAGEHALTESEREQLEQRLDNICPQNAIWWQAREIGSLSMGLHHDGSDRDIYALYDQPGILHKTGETKDSFFSSGEQFDIHAASTAKFLQRLRKSKDMSIQLLQTDIAYHNPNRISDKWSELQQTLSESYDRLPLFCHCQDFALTLTEPSFERGEPITYTSAARAAYQMLRGELIIRQDMLPPLRADALLTRASYLPLDTDFITMLFEQRRLGNGEELLTDDEIDSLHEIIEPFISREMESLIDELAGDSFSAEQQREWIGRIDDSLR